MYYGATASDANPVNVADVTTGTLIVFGSSPTGSFQFVKANSNEVPDVYCDATPAGDSNNRLVVWCHYAALNTNSGWDKSAEITVSGVASTLNQCGES